jgi:hypothetical protein
MRSLSEPVLPFRSDVHLSGTFNSTPSQAHAAFPSRCAPTRSVALSSHPLQPVRAHLVPRHSVAFVSCAFRSSTANPLQCVPNLAEPFYSKPMRPIPSHSLPFSFFLSRPIRCGQSAPHSSIPLDTVPKRSHAAYPSRSCLLLCLPVRGVPLQPIPAKTAGPLRSLPLHFSALTSSALPSKTAGPLSS